MKAFRALLLMLTLSVCAYAGEMPNDKDGNQGSGRYAGEIPNGKTGDMPCGLVTAMAFKLLQSVLTPF